MQLIPRKKLLLIFLFTFIIKLSTCLYLSYLSNCSQSNEVTYTLAQRSGDAPSYLDPIDNFIEKGSYFYQDGTNITHFGRAPYYGSIYYFFRLFAPKNTAYDLVSLFQILMESIAILYLSLLASKIIKHKYSFWITYILMMVSLNFTSYSTYLLTESLSISFLVIFSYYLCCYLHDYKNKNLFLAGIFLGLAVLLKPYFTILYIPIGIGFLLVKPFNILSIVKKVIVIALPLIILSTPYTIRNLISYKRFLTNSELFAGTTYTKADFAYHDFVSSWGGSFMFWDKRSAGCYFQPQKGIDCNFQFPEYAIDGGYNMTDIENVRNQYIRYQHNPTPALEDSVTNEFSRLRGLFKKYHPLRYFVLSPLIIMRDYVFHSGSYYLPIRKDFPCYHSYQMIIKVSQSVLYYLTLFAGFSGLIILTLRNKKTYMNLFIPVFLLFLFPFVFKYAEFRYFAPSHPFLVVGTSFILLLMWKKYLRNQHQHRK